ncbi:MAG: serine/threonine protein kinase, partial [Myxococcales bacterium]|nr:serine/threonine protein kinase [Myxococcales bacterium]
MEASLAATPIVDDSVPGNTPAIDDSAAPGANPPAEGPADPRQIDRFTVLDRLGSGGMGVVYAAYDPNLDRRVALKVLRPKVSASKRGETARTRLKREAQAMAKLSHPNVVTVYDVGWVGDQIFIAMEFVKGITLTKWMQQHPTALDGGQVVDRRSWKDVLEIFMQAGRGLAAAHKAGIIHRDFKPDNVLIGR